MPLSFDFRVLTKTVPAITELIDHASFARMVMPSIENNKTGNTPKNISIHSPTTSRAAVRIARGSQPQRKAAQG